MFDWLKCILRAKLKKHQIYIMKDLIRSIRYTVKKYYIFQMWF